jgi:hypothetical protein
MVPRWNVRDRGLELKLRVKHIRHALDWDRAVGRRGSNVYSRLFMISRTPHGGGDRDEVATVPESAAAALAGGRLRLIIQPR